MSLSGEDLLVQVPRDEHSKVADGKPFWQRIARGIPLSALQEVRCSHVCVQESPWGDISYRVAF